MKMLEPLLCIFHSVDSVQHCDDGFASAYAVWKKRPDTEFVPGVYQTPPPDVTRRDVVLVDFSYKRPVMEQLIKQANSVTILDHHKTAQADIQPLLLENKCQGVFDMNKCGCVLTWEWFNHPIDGHNPQDIPPTFKYLQDRDLWRMEFDETYRISMALRSYPQTFDVWDDLMWNHERLYREGEHIVRYYRRRVAAMKPSARWMKIGGIEMPVVNAPHFFASDLAGELAEEGNEVAACFWHNSNGSITFSLRARHGFDCSQIALKYGGGGHAGAAGFSVSSLEDL